MIKYIGIAICSIYLLLVIIGERDILTDLRGVVTFVIDGTHTIYDHYKGSQNQCDSLNIVEL